MYIEMMGNFLKVEARSQEQGPVLLNARYIVNVGKHHASGEREMSVITYTHDNGVEYLTVRHTVEEVWAAIKRAAGGVVR